MNLWFVLLWSWAKPSISWRYACTAGKARMVLVVAKWMYHCHKKTSAFLLSTLFSSVVIIISSHWHSSVTYSNSPVKGRVPCLSSRTPQVACWQISSGTKHKLELRNARTEVSIIYNCTQLPENNHDSLSWGGKGSSPDPNLQIPSIWINGDCG